MKDGTLGLLYTIGAVLLAVALIWLALMAIRHGIHGHGVYVRVHGGER